MCPTPCTRPYALLALLLGASFYACATPTSVNLVPTADVIGEGEGCVQMEADGTATPFERDAEYWLLTTWGVTDQVEVGVDRLEAEGDDDWFVDAKVQLLEEDEALPAVAVGAYGLGLSSPDFLWYVVATRHLGPAGVTVGFRRDDANRLQLGLTWVLSERTWLLADWYTGPYGFACLGLSHNAGQDTWVTLYVGRSNTSSEEDFIGLNIARYFSWGNSTPE